MRTLIASVGNDRGWMQPYIEAPMGRPTLVHGRPLLIFRREWRARKEWLAGQLTVAAFTTLTDETWPG